MQFNLVICGLDSVEARRWINATLVNMVDPEVPESLKPLIDGGTEGWSVRSGFAVTGDKPLVRLQGSSPCHPSYRVIVLRMFAGHAEQAHGIPHLHYRQYTSVAGALHRVGICSRVAPRLPRFLFSF